ncbi:hypothetical protein pipiens_000810, partial [Culex pipiens pipiens]
RSCGKLIVQLELECGTAEGVQEKEALLTGSLIGQLADADYLQIDDFHADGVVATGVVVGGILIAGDQLLQDYIAI